MILPCLSADGLYSDIKAPKVSLGSKCLTRATSCLLLYICDKRVAAQIETIMGIFMSLRHRDGKVCPGVFPVYSSYWV